MFWQCNTAIRFGIAFLVNEWLDKTLVCIGPDDDEKNSKTHVCLQSLFSVSRSQFWCHSNAISQTNRKMFTKYNQIWICFLGYRMVREKVSVYRTRLRRKKNPAKRMFVYWVCSACHGQSFHSIPKLLKRKKIDILTIKYSNQIWNCILVYRTIREKVGMYGPADKRKNKQKQTNRKKTYKII